MDQRVRGPHAVQLRRRFGGFRKHRGGMQRTARREHLEPGDVGFEDARVALGKSRRRAPPLLQLLAAGGRPRLDQNVAHAELFDEPQRLLARAGADGEHADHRADAEHDAQRGQQRPDRLRPQVFEGNPQIREDPADRSAAPKTDAAPSSARNRLGSAAPRLPRWRLLGGVGQRHDGAFVQALDDDLAFARPHAASRRPEQSCRRGSGRQTSGRRGRTGPATAATTRRTGRR